MNPSPTFARDRARTRTQRGVVLLYTLIALVIMMIAGVALVRSFNSSLFNAGNLAFKRDLANQAERARAQVVTALETGALSTENARQGVLKNENYSATVLASNNQGIPLALLSEGAFNGVGVAAKDIEVEIDGVPQQVTVRYVIDRQCLTTGTATKENCYLAGNTPQSSGNLSLVDTLVTEAQAVVYRLSIRVTGPRDTQAFLQSTFAL